MYTILVTDSNELVTTVKERIVQGSNLVDNLHFLAKTDYKGIDMTDFSATLEYTLPVSREHKTENLVRSDTLYKNMLEYKLPFDANLTKEAGEIEIKLTFNRFTLNAKGNPIQQVRKISTTTVSIVPITAQSDIVPDNGLGNHDHSELLATDEDIILLLTNQGYITLIGTNDGAIYTDNNGKLYVL